MIPIAVALLLGTRGLAKKFFYAACAFLSVVGVIVTFSRAGFLGMAGATFVFGWRLFPRNRWMLPVLFAVLLPVMIVLAPGGYGKRISTTSDDSAAARTDDLKRSIFIAARHPVFGVGLANYILYSNSNHATHNAYTQVAAEAGLLSAVFYILFLIVPLKQLRRISRETSLDRPRSYIYYLSVGLEASLVGYMVSSFFASVAYVWYAYYIVGYAICLRRLHDIEKNAEVRS
jgi:O-antigen ligase